MKKISNGLIGVLCLFLASGAYSKAPDMDVFQKCMGRTKQDRLTCSTGCGLILQQCYDEGVADINDRASRLLSQIKSESGSACKDPAETYLSDAMHMESDVAQKANDILGWAGSELALSFARQRLDNLGLIRQSCKP
ncbi:hypothetical protein J8I87_32785 [Paraburkholderia sp. LEh10]|uniref:hypothetical protein n=1 Tax=Paraburkholderia sp. LEh10 TaxID=2821353 RepID=UPI001AE23275|nr:hypothetical protein [Paraburkholderia sp. LEh10]MBP0594359.1 hypothetical protein [Paraburkholderia sp. LEh10]